MGDFLSKPSPPDSTSSTATAMSSPNPDQSSPTTPESETLIGKTPNPPTDPNAAETQRSEETSNNSTQEEVKNNNESAPAAGEGGEEEEEVGECGFCLFMKAGGCRDTFTEWEKCVQEGEDNKEDIVEKCSEVTSALKKCMEAHSDYYAPLLEAEKAAEAEAARQLEEERESLKKEGDGEREKEENLGRADEEKKSSS